MFPNGANRCSVGLTEGNTLTEAVEVVYGTLTDRLGGGVGALSLVSIYLS